MHAAAAAARTAAVLAVAAVAAEEATRWRAGLQFVVAALQVACHQHLVQERQHTVCDPVASLCRAAGTRAVSM
jgi:hypothetical protein